MSSQSPAEAAPPLVDTIDESPFYIPATMPQTRPRQTLKHGDSFVVLDSHGDINATEGACDGLFHHDTRFLSRLELLINGMPPLLLASYIRDDNSSLTVDLTNPDIYRDKNGPLILEKDTLHIVRTTFLWRATAYLRLAVRNHGDRPVRLQLSLGYHNDFADLFEVRGLRRERRGTAEARVPHPNQVCFIYDGLDDKTRRTTLLFEPAPTQIAKNTASYRLMLAPKQSASVFLTIACEPSEGAGRLPFYQAMLSARRALKIATRRVATVETSNDVFNEVLCRAMADLYMLVTDTPEGPYPYAGTPWYSTTFGRDGLITALEMLWFDPLVARGVLRRLAAYQAQADDDVSDAQPGKILHEMRGGELAALGIVPFGLYYGSVDSTPLFVMLAGLYAERTGDHATLAELWPAIEAALAWMDGPADPDHDGFVEYSRATEQGLANQGWKDSYDAIFHSDGRLAQGPIALAEVQGYVYAAKQHAARCARRLGHEQRAQDLERQAARLAERFEDAFWCPEIGSYAIAIDGAKRPCRVQSSNAGQLLFTGIVRPDRARKVAEGLLKPNFFSGWGVRTISSAECRYNPMSYHNGSVWPHDNALVALGFARYGFKDAVDRIFTGLFEAAAYMDLRRLPELFCGFQRRRGRGPTLYPVACTPQAWASGAPFLLLQASLGLEFDPAKREIRLRSPHLPSFLQEVTLSNLQLGDASIDLAIKREGNNTSLLVRQSRGSVQVCLV